LQIACGASKLWAGIRPWQAKDLPGANLSQLRDKAISRELVAMLHLADATFHGQAGVTQDIREAVRWYDKVKGTLDNDGVDMASPVDVDVMVMMTGPIPIDLYPASLVRGYRPAWLAVAMNLDSRSESSSTSLSKFEREMVGDHFELTPDVGIPAMWMYHAASTADMAQAQLNLAIWYVHGQHVPRSLQQACYWFERAAEAGLQDAQYNLGLLLQQGGSIPMDHKKAAHLYQLAVDQGHIDAHLSLGMCYLEGKGVEKDTEWAVKLLHIPANKGSAIAQFNLGCLYSRGLGVCKDDARAVSFYIRAAGQGHREAQICYAMALYRGEGTAKNLAHAARLFEEAGTMGHPQAQYNIGVMYSKGEGVPKDREKAAFWWEKSASQGHGSAQLELGQYYLLLARETVQRYFDARVAKLRQIVASTEYFEKFIMVEKWELGFGKVEGVPLMNVRLFLRMLTEFMLLIPEAITREETVSMMQKIDRLRDDPFENNFSYRKFKVYVRGLGKLIGVDLEAGASAGVVDQWMLAKERKKLDKIKKQEEKAFTKKVKQEMIESQGIFSYLREGKLRKMPRFDDAQVHTSSPHVL
jgi:TPR repeat protein